VLDKVRNLSKTLHYYLVHYTCYRNLNTVYINLFAHFDFLFDVGYTSIFDMFENQNIIVH